MRRSDFSYELPEDLIAQHPTAARSASQDYIFVNVAILPLFTIVDGRRRGMRQPWLYFVSSLFTSCAFGFCLYFFVAERLRRHGAWTETAAPGHARDETIEARSAI